MNQSAAKLWMRPPFRFTSSPESAAMAVMPTSRRATANSTPTATLASFGVSYSTSQSDVDETIGQCENTPEPSPSGFGSVRSAHARAPEPREQQTFVVCSHTYI